MNIFNLKKNLWMEMESKISFRHNDGNYVLKVDFEPFNGS